ncbi:hypothetical protein Pfo_002060 [Paulownia fortunei]|nr:hypothetical protein Pfo_002060 [Paulownia fortunei]
MATCNTKIANRIREKNTTLMAKEQSSSTLEVLILSAPNQLEIPTLPSGSYPSLGASILDQLQAKEKTLKENEETYKNSVAEKDRRRANIEEQLSITLNQLDEERSKRDKALDFKKALGKE